MKKKQIKAIYGQYCTSDSVSLENDIQAQNEVLFSPRSEKHSNANNYCNNYRCQKKSGNFLLKAKNSLGPDGQLAMANKLSYFEFYLIKIDQI